ncbi:protein timeless homolog [Diaphorina citri]|uniref:Protein timeless homolog n=1 Tax=Diaphorina citri TaxID=121845 RepID=A0A3Q0JCS6_DIACI|nr:protein timeless homolog [Diaphorina citri]
MQNSMAKILGQYPNKQVKKDQAHHRGVAVQSKEQQDGGGGAHETQDWPHSIDSQAHIHPETMAVNIFHFLQTQIDTWLSNMAIEKKKITLWSRRVHIALKAYKEMVLTLLSMISSDDEGVRRSAATIQSNIFYILEYRELVLVLFYAYQETKFSREYLKDLLETTHVFLKMLEHSCKHKKLVVQKHGRMRKAKSTKSTGKRKCLM